MGSSVCGRFAAGEEEEKVWKSRVFGLGGADSSIGEGSQRHRLRDSRAKVRGVTQKGDSEA